MWVRRDCGFDPVEAEAACLVGTERAGRGKGWRDVANKVIGGTPRSDSASLCLTCRAAWHMKTVNLGEVIMCRAFNNGFRILAPVVECATYDDKRQPSLYDMQQIAWEVTSRARGSVGFGGARDLTIEITPPSDNSRNRPAPPTSGVGEELGQ